MEWIAWYIILLNWLQYLILKPPLHKVGVPTCVEPVGRRPLPYPGPPPRGYRSRWPASHDLRRTGPPPREPATPRSFLWWNKQIESQQIRLFTTRPFLESTIKSVTVKSFIQFVKTLMISFPFPLFIGFLKWKIKKLCDTIPLIY